MAACYIINNGNAAIYIYWKRTGTSFIGMVIYDGQVMK